MFAETFRIAAGISGVPAGMAARGWQRFRTGRRAVVDLTVAPVAEAKDRVELVARIRRLAVDPSVVGVRVRITGLPGRWAACQDLRAALLAVSAAGKETIAWVRTPGTAALWVASACNTVCMVPTDGVTLLGFGTEMVFLGTALERLGIGMDVISAGEYKSAAEQFTRSFPSPENQEAITAILTTLQEQVVLDLATARRRTPAEMQAVLEGGPYTAEEAKAKGLVDRLMYGDQLEEWADEFFGSKTRAIGFESWAARDARMQRVAQWGEPRRRVAVVYLDGGIRMEDPSDGIAIRGAVVAPILRSLRKDDDIAAVVLHINSPGGTVLASDVIWHEVDELARVKPVVASYEDVSASGGVYLSSSATEIYARPGTITGSIGVVGGKPVFGDALRKLGAHDHTIALTGNANLYSVFSRWTDEQRALMKKQMVQTYDDFVGRVAAGRGVEPEAIEPYCRGRVWMGTEAVKLGLIDGLGDVNHAIDRARHLAALPATSRVEHVDGQPHKTWIQKQIRGAIRESLPGAASLQLLADQWIPAGLRGQVAVFAANPGVPLAMLPVWLSPK